ncbi:hypothetical protein TNCT_626011 [Trichonephila clavata]|uniref:Uncharacterized protein n=1 Tax=Trichonephila clavata TaxID=2740835 RepID=A0A8X6HYQ1_TRICU|nr:hypothetical protein TNCT_626011 [Trichonephila clavata]
MSEHVKYYCPLGFTSNHQSTEVAPVCTGWHPPGEMSHNGDAFLQRIVDIDETSETGCSSPYVLGDKTTSVPNSTQRAFKTHFVVLGTLLLLRNTASAWQMN